MNSHTDALEISGLIITTLEEVKTSIDEKTQLIIKKTLAGIDEMPPEIQKNSIEKVLEILSRYASVRLHLTSKLQSLASSYPETEANQIRSFLRYLPLEEPIGSLYVCPIDPEHYRRRLIVLTEQSICPLHGVQLVNFE